jgi:restriction system protein
MPWAKVTCATSRARSTLRARPKGVFVTTAGFTRAAKDYVARSPKRIVLIDGEELARLMVRHGIGVRTRVYHEVKRIDEDYFDQEAP